MPVSREAVIWGFKFFLGRAPESEAAVISHLKFPDEDALAKHLVASSEFMLKKPFQFENQAIDAPSPQILKAERWLSPLNTRIAVLGNCQARGVATLIQAMTSDVAAKGFECNSNFIESLKSNTQNLTAFVDADLIFAHHSGDWIQLMQKTVPDLKSKLKFIPPITFSAFHPDCVYVHYDNKHLSSPIGAYNSSLVFHGWRNKFTVEQTISLFNTSVYEHLGFFNYWNSSVTSLTQIWSGCGLSLEKYISRWATHGAWMHSINHPKLYVLADVARAALDAEGFNVTPSIEYYIEDRLASGPCWPVYPEIGKALGLSHLPRIVFKKGMIYDVNAPSMMIELDDFVKNSFEIYEKYQTRGLSCERIQTEKYMQLHKFLKYSQRSLKTSCSQSASVDHPYGVVGVVRKKDSVYTSLPDYRFWRRGVASSNVSDIDPIVHTSFKLGHKDKVATAGSCFAQHISRTLIKNGFNYYVAESLSDTAEIGEVTRRNFGVFSARFGNLYSARQLVQLFDRAYGTFNPEDNYWQREDGKIVDPFRPQIEPDGFASVEDMEADRRNHLACVREMFEQLDVFVFTLGLTEAWQSRVDGAVFPLAPGVVAGEMNRDRYEFVNFKVSDVVADMQSFIARLSSLNPKAKLLLTVSPVPLIATFEDQHVLSSTTYSKSVLRAAAGEICANNLDCEYFPSYEIITGSYTRGKYFEEDLRSVTTEGVEHVMRLFLKHYSSDLNFSKSADNPDATTHVLFPLALEVENNTLSKLICDEEALDR